MLLCAVLLCFGDWVDLADQFLTQPVCAVATAYWLLPVCRLLEDIRFYSLSGVGVASAHWGACKFGVCGLLAAAARARSTGSSAQRRAASFVVATALALALSLAASVALLVGRGALLALLTHWGAALDALGDCLAVALFSGLIGPPSLQVLARDAFSTVNCYTDDQLQSFYEKYLEYLDRAQEHPDPTGVKLRLLVQQLDMLHASDDHAGFNDELHPELQRIEAASGMPKPGSHPSVRTVAEESQLKEALSAMEQIYSICKKPVFVLPMDGDVDAGGE
ncbi:unnamed protein product [Prorocentrum cordatum]|uniref:Uncharacterized protein n=1 Tax=Prorocentrum cordatum TaxID=2364126 RepID=A0ABN9S5M2_9DINO|nr:unnamed protein product [Polarella glacialis]